MIQLHASKALFAKLSVDEHGRLPEQPQTAYLSGREPHSGSSLKSSSLNSSSLNSSSGNPLSGWHAHLFSLQRRQCVLWVHDATRFSLFMPCLTKPDFVALQWHFVDSLMNTLLKVGASDEQMQTAERLLQPLVIDAVCSRSVQGTLNRMKGDVEHMLNYDGVSVTELSGYRTGVWLADRPCNIKGYVLEPCCSRLS